MIFEKNPLAIILQSITGGSRRTLEARRGIGCILGDVLELDGALIALGIGGNTAIYSMPDLQLLGTVPVGREPNWVTFSRDSKFAYVSNRRDNTLSVISIPERKEVARLKVGEFPQRMTTSMVAQRPN